MRKKNKIINKKVPYKHRIRENKKVINATPHTVDGINFKSGLEVFAYKKLKEEGFNPIYEGETITTQDSFSLPDNIKVYLSSSKIVKNTDGKKITLYGQNTSKIRDIKYTPDFVFDYKGYHIMIETKGMPNDSYPLRRKLFFNSIKNKLENILFFEPHSKSQIIQTITYIKNL